MTGEYLVHLICSVALIGLVWTVVAFTLWGVAPITIQNTWCLWPLWAGPLIIIATPLIIVLALHLPLVLLLPCKLLLRPFLGLYERHQQRVAETAFQMEEGRRANQMIYTPEAINANAGGLAVERAAREHAVPLGRGETGGVIWGPPARAAPEYATPLGRGGVIGAYAAPFGGGGTDVDMRGPPPSGAKVNDTSIANEAPSKDTPQSGGAVELASIKKPTGNDIASTVAPPAPAHIDR